MKGALKLGKQKEGPLDLDLISFVSHELKTPLSTLRLNVDVLKEKISEKDRRILDIMDEEVDWMIQFIADTLDLQKDRLSLNFQWCKWNRWIKEVGERIDKKVTLFNRKWQMNLLQQEVDVYMDPFYLRQVVLNLVMNAVEHSPENSTIEMVCEKTEKNGLGVYVKDQGSGVEEEVKDKIFKPFYKGRAKENSVGKGSGLGLTIVKKIVQAHGGSVEAFNNSEGKGAVFAFYLPQVR